MDSGQKHGGINVNSGEYGGNINLNPGGYHDGNISVNPGGYHGGNTNINPGGYCDGDIAGGNAQNMYNGENARVHVINNSTGYSSNYQNGDNSGIYSTENGNVHTQNTPNMRDGRNTGVYGGGNTSVHTSGNTPNVVDGRRTGIIPGGNAHVYGVGSTQNLQDAGNTQIYVGDANIPGRRDTVSTAERYNDNRGTGVHTTGSMGMHDIRNDSTSSPGNRIVPPERYTSVSRYPDDKERWNVPNRHDSGVGNIRHGQLEQFTNEVDSWIDELDDNRSCTALSIQMSGIGADVLMASLVQQFLPPIDIPKFSGHPLDWVEFIVSFRDVVHNQPYFNDRHRHQHLVQNLIGEAKVAVKEYRNDPRGYVAALKKIKYLFGQRATVARAIISKVIKGKPVGNHDSKGLSQLYYDVCNCLVTLKQLNYAADLYSTDTLAQAVKRVPPYLSMKWAEKSLFIRNRGEEPTLVHFGEWLKQRVLVLKETVSSEEVRKKNPQEMNHINVMVTNGDTCQLCGVKHQIWKCKQYKALNPGKKWEFIKGLDICMNCFKSGHKKDGCTSDNKCPIENCGKKHHASLHKAFLEREETQRAARERRRNRDRNNDNPENENVENGNGDEVNIMHCAVEPEVENGDTQMIAVSNSRRSKRVFLQIVPVTIVIGEKSVDTYALLDNGAQYTLLREEFFNQFNVLGTKGKMNQGTIKDPGEDVAGTYTSLTVSCRNGNNAIVIEDVFVQPDRLFNMPSRPEFTDYNERDFYTHLDDLSLEAVRPEEISILIGGDAPECHISTEVRRGRKGQPLAFKTPFAWALFGSSRGNCRCNVQCMATYNNDAVQASLPTFWEEEEQSPAVFVNLVRTRTDTDLHEAVEEFWKQEHCGILPQKDLAMSWEDKAALERMEKETLLVKGHYQIPMLWRDIRSPLPNNITMAKKRFEFLKKKLRSDEKLYSQYKAVIEGYLNKDPPYARKLEPEEVYRTSHKTWTLPTFPVFHPQKPNKPRVVNDAAAEFHGVSLNKELLTGPDLLTLLVGVMMRARNGSVAISADIEAMFHQVRVSPEDADALRFLWMDDISSDKPPDVYQMLVHIFGAKDSPTVANYAVKRTARETCHQFSALAFETALRSFYVDDLLKAVNSVDEAVSLAKEMMDMLKSRGFRLCKFLSNSKAVMEALPKSELSTNATLIIQDESKLDRALGIMWDTQRDIFTFTFQQLDLPATKRGILKTAAKLFDPLGHIMPFIVSAKIIIQVLWRIGCDWDEEVDEEIKKQWERWLAGAQKVGEIQIPRQYVVVGERSVVSVELHVFCDASEDAYGSCAYVRYTFKSGEHECALVMAKSRLAPIKTVNLPRLETNGARSGARLARLVLHEIDLPIERVRYWSDSTLTLQYIKNTKNRLKIFVANRVAEILESSDPEDWAHVPGDINPADMLTRGIVDPTKLIGTRWFIAPEFLEKEEEMWPNLDINHLSQDDVEIKKKPLFIGLNYVEVEEVNFDKISNWQRLLRVAAWVMRFADNCLNKDDRRLDETLAMDEINAAEQLVVRDMQNSAFHVEMKSLKDGKELHTSNRLSSLSPFVDDNDLLRVGGRLKRIPIPLETKHPLILPRHHRATKVLVEWIHRRSGHVGPEHTLAISREKYWIMSGRVLVNQVVIQCFFCRVRRAKQQFPYMADLPTCRAAIDQPPFHECGVDLFGPISVKQCRKRLKRWVVLFTCLTIRCVHLEIVEACDTDAFINAVRRFVNRRGSPSNMYSDNGTNFKGATTELHEFIQKLDKNKITDYATTNHITWTFNPPGAPHMGGAWERLVRSTKEVMFGLMKEHTLTDSQLLTFVTEAEAIVNSRPLTHLSDDAMDLEALTPNHVLLGQHRNWTSITDVSEADICSRRQWKRVQALRAMFWSRWVQEYLPLLTKRARWRVNTPAYQVGELVLVKDDDVKRSKWPLGRIVEIKQGTDGVVRVVKVRMKDGEYVRPVAKIFKLEDNVNDTCQGEENVIGVKDDDGFNPIRCGK